MTQVIPTQNTLITQLQRKQSEYCLDVSSEQEIFLIKS